MAFKFIQQNEHLNFWKIISSCRTNGSLQKWQSFFNIANNKKYFL